ncbi:unnamed protein product [Urochloa humidicola]
MVSTYPPVQVNGVAGEGQIRCGSSVPGLLLVRALLHLSLATTVLLTKPRPEHFVHQTMSLHLGQQAMIAPAVASRCLPCQERLSVDIFYLKVWRFRNVSFSGGLPSKKSV